MAKKYILQLVGPIKRVIRQNGQFICGICQDQYPKMIQALDCLHECWFQFHKLPPVVMRKSALRWQYRCRFCARDFSQFKEAKSCSDNCLAGLSISFDKEWSLLDYTPAKTKRYQPKPKPMIAYRTRDRQGGSHGEVKPSDPEITQPDETGPQSKEPLAPVHSQPLPIDDLSVAGVESVAEAEKNSKQKKERDHGFYRDGARYVCQECNTKHFTKEDVMTCFNSHAKT